MYPRLGPISLWDTAAAQCMVEQAGGKVVQWSGKPLSYGNLVVILNPFFVVHWQSGQDWPALFSDVAESTSKVS